MLAKVFLGTTAVVFSGYVLVPPFRRKLERNILKPIRNYRRILQQPFEFKTEEEFHGFLVDLAMGSLRMFTIESDQ